MFIFQLKTIGATSEEIAKQMPKNSEYAEQQKKAIPPSIPNITQLSDNQQAVINALSRAGITFSDGYNNINLSYNSVTKKIESKGTKGNFEYNNLREAMDDTKKRYGQAIFDQFTKWAEKIINDFKAKTAPKTDKIQKQMTDSEEDLKKKTKSAKSVGDAEQTGKEKALESIDRGKQIREKSKKDLAAQAQHATVTEGGISIKKETKDA